MRNIISRSPAKLIPQITQVIPGVTNYGAGLGMPAGLEADLGAKKTALVQKDALYEQGRTARKTSLTTRNLAFKNAQNHMRTVREILRPTLTATYSQAWDAFGFTGKLSLPNSVNALVTALTKLASHLAAHPELGAEEPNLVAAKATALENALSTAVTSYNQKKADVQRLKDDRAEAAEAARILVREVLSVLHLKLEPLDSRWVEFGFNKPGAQPTPDVPTGLTAVQLGNALSVKWPAVPRAEYYRFWKRIIGVDPELVAVDTTAELVYVLHDIPANAQVEVALSAGNNGGESNPSTVLSVQMV